MRLGGSYVWMENYETVTQDRSHLKKPKSEGYGYRPSKAREAPNAEIAVGTCGFTKQ